MVLSRVECIDKRAHSIVVTARCVVVGRSTGGRVEESTQSY